MKISLSYATPLSEERIGRANYSPFVITVITRNLTVIYPTNKTNYPAELYGRVQGLNQLSFTG
jgi:hypothetical protein